jgi:hypothetical protein
MTIIGSLRSLYHRWQDNRRPPSELELWWQERERNLAARKEARSKGQTYVTAHIRRRGTA